jgi:hypothetical protein
MRSAELLHLHRDQIVEIASRHGVSTRLRRLLFQFRRDPCQLRSVDILIDQFQV